jgi:radical SAM protein with 4Fe4S-binding SPASM domain
MRVARHVYILDGARRAALYDERRQIVYALDSVQADIIKVLAAGKQYRFETDRPLRNEQIQSLAKMRAIGWLVPGAPLKKSLWPPPLTNGKVNSKLKHVWLEVTNACNLKCRHCYAESGPAADRSNELTEVQWEGVIADVLQHGCATITFIGGEPLIRSSLLDRLIPYARNIDANVTIRIFSNLTHVPRLRELLPIIVKNRVSFGTSLYGYDAETHDAMTKVKGSWQRTIAAVSLLKEHNVRVFAGLYFNFTKSFDRTRAERWARSIGIDSIEILAPSKVGRGSMIEWLPSHGRNVRPTSKSYAYRSLESNLSSHNCFSDHMSVKPTGDVNPCIMQRNISYGNLPKDGMEHVLSSEQRQRMSSLTKDLIEGCRDCEFRYGCFDCRPDAVGTSGNMFAKPNCGYDPYGDVLES